MNKKKLINDVKLGSDPEVFLYNTKNEEFFSAVGLIKGTKKDLYLWIIFLKDLCGK